MNKVLTHILVLALLSVILCCRNASDKKREVSPDTNISMYDSIEYYYERSGQKDLKFQDTILGYMGYAPFDQYHLDTLSDRIYRLTQYVAIGSTFTIIEIFCDSGIPVLKYGQFKFDHECNEVNGSRPYGPDCFIKQAQFEKQLTLTQCDSINSIIEQEEIFDLKTTSQKQRNIIIFDGEDWRLDIRYMVYENTFGDTTLVRTHSIDRFIPEEYHSIYTVGNYFNELSGG